MGVEIVQYDIDTGGIWKQFINQIAHRQGEITLGAAGSHEYLAVARFGRNKDEQVTRAVALVFVILSERLSRLNGQWLTYISQQLHAFLIEADQRTVWVMWSLIQSQDRLHALNEQWGQAGNTPAFHLPGLELVFFNTRRTVSGAMCSTRVFRILCKRPEQVS